jgi:hypothetical protein
MADAGHDLARVKEVGTEGRRKSQNQRQGDESFKQRKAGTFASAITE